MNHKIVLCALFSVVAFVQSTAQTVVDTAFFRAKNDTITAYCRERQGTHNGYVGRVRLDSIRLSGKNLNLYYSPTLAQYPLRADVCQDIYAILREGLPQSLSGYNLRAVTEGKEIRELIPAYYKEKDVKKKAVKRKNIPTPLITPLDKADEPTEGLYGRHIAMWQSHGYYYEQKLLRWEWQRARIFQTVEDLFTQSYVLPYVVPMLERAGAVVILPRERDWQKVEIISDNDTPVSGYHEKNGKYAWSKGEGEGFANPKKYYLDGENPFTMGTYRQANTVAKGEESVAVWQPEFEKEGTYAVYVSYKTLPNSADDAMYTVYHKDGKTSFKVNQQMAGGTWIYLGKFDFDKGSAGRVELSNKSAREGRVITADAVKIGGGMGNIARTVPSDTAQLSGDARRVAAMGITPDPIVSGYPRFTEGARYFMQWSGVPHEVYSAYGQDYTDDYAGRPRWVNYLAGGTKINPEGKGLGIPVDLSFAFHSDAGTKIDNTIVGILSIYTLQSNGGTEFLDGDSRYANRDLADLVQTQITNDVRTQCEPNFTRRQLMNGNYAESRIPEVPSMLLELLSHQNFADMRYGLDPRFRFVVSRAIYKGILKFLSAKDGRPYVVQPLPVDNFSVEFAGNDKVQLKWRPVADSLEPTAKPDSYIVYTRKGDGSFDNGTLVKDTAYTASVAPGQMYSFKVTAVNKGGESFDSETLSAMRALNEKGTVLIVNGFDRVSAPESFATRDSTYAGFQDIRDGGVPYIQDIAYIGAQHEFRRRIPWMDDDSAGFGASNSDYETTVVAGNTFDYPAVHGRSLAELGYSFVSASNEAVANGQVDMKKYKAVDMIMGKQRRSQLGHNENRVDFEVFPKDLRKAIADYTAAGGNILVSGAYVATDLWDTPKPDQDGKDFARNVLKFRWMTDCASNIGEVEPAVSPYSFLAGNYAFETKQNEDIYAIESPDGLVPAGNKAFTIMRYTDNNISAGIAYKGDDYRTVVLGFPVEVIKGHDKRTEFLGKVMEFFFEGSDK